MRGRSLIGYSASLLSLMLLVALGSSVLRASAETSIDPKLALSGDRFDYGPPGTKILVGTISNMGDGPCDVFMRVNLYGASHVFLHNREEHRNDIDSGGRWDFRLQITDPNVVEY